MWIRLLTPRYPVPASTDDDVRTIALASHLARRNHVEVLSLVGSDGRSVDERLADSARDRGRAFDLTVVTSPAIATLVRSSGPIVLDGADVVGATSRPRRSVDKVLDLVDYAAERQTIWARVDGCVFTSAEAYEASPAPALGIPSAVVPNGLDLALYPRSPAVAGGVSIVGADTADRESTRVLDAICATVMRELPEARITVVGARARSRTEGITFTGTVAESAIWTRDAAVVLALAHARPAEILEAMAFGRPVILAHTETTAIDVLGTPGTIVAQDAQSIAVKLLELLRNPAHARCIGDEGRALVERRYDWDRLALEFELFLRAVRGARQTYRFALGRERVG